MMLERMERCRKCEELKEQIAGWERRFEELVGHVERLELRVGQLLEKNSKSEARIKQLQEELRGKKKDSTNSSKPPSSDIVKASPKKSANGQRRLGGQVGHASQQRPAFEPEQIDAVQRYAHESCPRCGGPVEQLLAPAQVIQQVELVTKPMLVTEHVSCTCHCRVCGQDFTQPLPPQVVAAGTFGPRLTTFVAYLKAGCHTSFRTIQQLLLETYQLSIATGTLAKLCQKVSRSLDASYAELRRQIPQQTALNIDETGHRENGQWQWTWVFRAPQFTLFHIDPKRGTNVLKHVLGSEFSGTLMADYYSAYRCYLASQPRADAQFCLAHLIRDVKFLNESANQADRQFATALLVELKELFRLWNTASTDGDEATFRAALIAQGERLESLAMEQAPNTKASRRVRKRFAKHAKEYLRFTHVPGIEPTNNAAERAIRQIVIDRKVTQGTRSPRGRAWCERIWTTIATCRQHGRDLLSFLQQSLLALLTDTPPPSLLAPHN